MSGLQYKPRGIGLGVLIRANFPAHPRPPKRDSSLLSKTQHSNSRQFKENKGGGETIRSRIPQSRRPAPGPVPPIDYFRTHTKQEIESPGFEDWLFEAFWTKEENREGTGGSKARIPKEFESFEVNKLNDRSIHFSKLDESLTIERQRAAVQKSPPQYTQSPKPLRNSRLTILESINRLKEDIQQADMGSRCRVRLLDSLATMRQAIREDVVSQPLSFREPGRTWTPKRRGCFR